jgi:hypothetical protein
MQPIIIPSSFPIQWNKPYQFIVSSGESEDLNKILSKKDTKIHLFKRNLTEEQEKNSLFRQSLAGATLLPVISHVDDNFQLVIKPMDFSSSSYIPKAPTIPDISIRYAKSITATKPSNNTSSSKLKFNRNLDNQWDGQKRKRKPGNEDILEELTEEIEDEDEINEQNNYKQQMEAYNYYRTLKGMMIDDNIDEEIEGEENLEFDPVVQQILEEEALIDSSNNNNNNDLFPFSQLINNNNNNNERSKNNSSNYSDNNFQFNLSGALEAVREEDRLKFSERLQI